MKPWTNGNNNDSCEEARILGDDVRRNHTFENEYNIKDSQVVRESKNEKTIDQ